MENARTFTLRLASLLSRERAALGEFLVALASFDEHRLWVDLGYRSLFDFLHRELRLSKGAAFYRNTAAALVQRFPEIIDPLRDGRLCLMTVAEVARVLDPGNVADVLPRFFGLSKREAQALVATLLPQQAPALRDLVTSVRAAPVAPALALSAPAAPPTPRVDVAVLPVEPAAPGSGACALQPIPPVPAVLPCPPSITVEPLTAELRRIHFTAPERFLEKYEAAKAALSHSRPGAGAAELLELGLDLLLAKAAKQKGLVKKPRREPRPSADPGHVPAHVKRAVWERDEGKCQWKLASGGICGSTRRLQLDHVIPRARGGPSTVENCRILCDVHNDLAAREVFGNAWMDRFTDNPRRRPRGRRRGPTTTAVPAAAPA